MNPPTTGAAMAANAPLDLYDWLAALKAADEGLRLAALTEAVRNPAQMAAWADEGLEAITAWEMDLGVVLTKTQAKAAASTLRKLAKTRAEEARRARRTEAAEAESTYDGRCGWPEPEVEEALQKKPATRFAPETTKANAWNLGTILSMDSRWNTRLRHNEFRCEDEIEVGTEETGEQWRSITDVDVLALGRWVAEVYRLDFQTPALNEQIALASSKTKTHPVREYLATLPPWDGRKRLDEWMADAFGAERTPLTAAVGTAWLVSMVARVMQPGCKVDTVPVLVGKQGKLKSTTLAALVPEPSWFCDTAIPMGHAQDRYQVLAGVWFYEIGEIDRYSSKHDASEIKAYISSRHDRYRASYGRRMLSVPRQVVFSGSTNQQEFLVDPTGSRRFWPVPVGACDPSWVLEFRDQLWAEALHRYRAGESWWLSSESSGEMAEVADQYRVGDPWEGAVSEWLDESGFDEVTVAQVLDVGLQIPVRDHDKSGQMRVAAILTTLGWTKATRRRDPVTKKVASPTWVKP